MGKIANIIKYLIYGAFSLMISLRAAGLGMFLAKQEFGPTAGLMVALATFLLFMGLFWGTPLAWRKYRKK